MRAISKSAAFLIILSLLSVSLGACASPKTTEVRIGAVYPLTGALATVGVRSKNAIELAVDIINNEYNLDLPFAKTKGIAALKGAKLQVVFADSQGVPETAMAETERLITSQNVTAVMGCFQSASAKTASQAAERLQTPFLNADSISPELAARGFTWYFQTTPDANTFVENWFKFLDDVGKAKGIDPKALKLGLLYENTDAGVDTSKAQEKFAKQYGYTIATKIAYPSQASDLSSEVMKLKSQNVDVVMQVSYTSDAILFTKAMKSMDYNPKAILPWDSGHTDPAYLAGVGADGNYLFVGDVWSLAVSNKKPVVKAVNDLYKQKYGADMDASSARAFTGIFVLADAVQRAASTDKEKVRQALKDTNMAGSQLIMAWSGIKFDQSNGRNLLAENVITQIQNGQYKIVWPSNLANAEIIWPMPKWSDR
jgi:branched-chain amino acid transport system substrate-binding protein